MDEVLTLALTCSMMPQQCSTLAPCGSARTHGAMALLRPFTKDWPTCKGEEPCHFQTPIMLDPQMGLVIMVAGQALPVRGYTPAVICSVTAKHTSIYLWWWLASAVPSQQPRVAQDSLDNYANSHLWRQAGLHAVGLCCGCGEGGRRVVGLRAGQRCGAAVVGVHCLGQRCCHLHRSALLMRSPLQPTLSERATPFFKGASHIVPILVHMHSNICFRPSCSNSL